MDLDKLRKTMLFRNMSTHEIEEALKELDCRERIYSKGEAVFIAGDFTDELGLVLEGSVTIESNDIWGNCTVLSHVGESGFFAETYSLLQGEPLMVDVFANERSRILFFNVSRLITEEENKPWVFKMLKNLVAISAYKNMMLSIRSFNTSPKSAKGRIMSYLNSVSLKNKSVEFDIPFDRQQMANYLNLDRTALSKALSKMSEEGIIEFRKNHFKIIRKG